MQPLGLKRVVQVVTVATIALPLLVCAQQPATPPADRTPVPAPGDVAARVGDRTITVAELDAAWRAAEPASHAQAATALYEGRRQALDRLVEDLLIEGAAKAKGIGPEEFAKQEVARRMRVVSDGDVEAFYQQNSSRMQGKPLDQVRSAIRSFLQQQRQAEARAALVAELRASGPAVRVALDPPRQKIDVAGNDPRRGAANGSVVLVEYSDYQ